MSHSRLIQTPSPGQRLLRFRGDTVTFLLTSDLPLGKGTAWLRTNLGNAATARREIIREILREEPPLGRDWHDLPMIPLDGRRFTITLPLTEVGHFEAKTLFLPEGDTPPLWPEGLNTAINVQAAGCCAGNVVYNAFVRQFGPNKTGGTRPSPEQAACISSLDAAGYTVIPRSGTFRDLIRELDFIFGHLGCRYLQLLPIHPTPTTYARMGRFGSPYASLSFTAVDPGLAEFDPAATPLEQFTELLDAVHARQGRLILDIAINHTGWAARLHETHPEWLCRDAQGRIEMPGAWGVVWADLTKLDYRHQDLWAYIARVFLIWCRRGVDGFRCDAGYMIPVKAWRYIVAMVREQYPDTIFFLEGLGGKISVTRDLLNTANLDWAYSELFQNYDQAQIGNYLPESFDIGSTDGVMIHFCETHDNNRLAATSAVWARMRTALCALFSQNGGFAFANGVEWLATEKINVHEAMSLNWGAADNLVDHLRRLIDLLKTHPAFHDQTELRFLHDGTANGMVLLRHHRPSGAKLLVAVNLTDREPITLSWYPDQAPPPPYRDLLTGRPVEPTRDGDRMHLHLEPGQTFCLSPLRDGGGGPGTVDSPTRVDRQRLRAKVMEAWVRYNGIGHLGDWDPDAEADRLVHDPLAWCAAMNPRGDGARAVNWRWPEDLRREVMIPPGHFLLVRAPHPFRARVAETRDTLAQEESLTAADGSHFALFPPLPTPAAHQSLSLRLSVFGPAECRHDHGALLLLADPDAVKVRTRFDRHDILKTPRMFLATNGRGGMCRASVRWGELPSKYDALLAANLSPLHPEDRRVLFTRCRGWIVFQGYSTEIHTDCLESFSHHPDGRGRWHFHVPTGQGENIHLLVDMEMIPDRNVTRLRFRRIHGERKYGLLNAALDDAAPVRLILRPDIEDRNFHEVTKAYTGPETHFPRAISPRPDGFDFTPGPGRRLSVSLSNGQFHSEPEWYYMVHRPLDAERGQDPHSDLFSPGYFSAWLPAGGEAVLTADADGHSFPASSMSPATTHDIGHPESPVFGDESQMDFPAAVEMAPALSAALSRFVVRRDGFRTVIAGYPWFLDWGRDTLIVVRGLIADGRLRESADILTQFALFERNGTLPNMIRGNDAGNRDTSDAPLWFFVACADLVRTAGETSFLAAMAGDRSIREVLTSLARSILGGTPNGIRVDPESGLVYSPSHFTWMDTNYPAATPRQGYPVEIQAFWHFALTFLSGVDPENRRLWRSLAADVRKSITSLFFRPDKGHFADCLHSEPGCGARRAVPDDHLRPNQLFLITLDAVDDPALTRPTLLACESLLVPGAIRTLADRPVDFPLPVRYRDRPLNDPRHPYWGRYDGDEDTRRKPAYHNGTAWTWPFPSFCEAWVKVYGDDGVPAAKAWLASITRLLDAGCAGQPPEIVDGDHPHLQRGCDAQAWGVSEALRVWRLLDAMTAPPLS